MATKKTTTTKAKSTATRITKAAYAALEKQLASLRVNILIEMLKNSKFKFRSIDTLSTAVGETPAKTEELLRAIGARPSNRNRTGKNGWTLPADVAQTLSVKSMNGASAHAA